MIWRWLAILCGRRSHLDSATTNSSLPLADTDQRQQHEAFGNSTSSVCFCEIKVFGPRLAVEKLRKSLQGFDPTIPSMEPAPHSDFCFGSIIPINDSLIKLNSLVALEKVRQGLWGTHGNAYGITLKQGPHSLRYHFATWETPAMKVFERLIKLNPHLKFEIEVNNPNTGFKMTVIGRKGQVFRWMAPNLYANEKVGYGRMSLRHPGNPQRAFVAGQFFSGI